MAESWKTVKASDVVEGQTIRTDKGDVVEVTRIEENFLGRDNMIAFIEDTSTRWYKRPVAADSEVEVREVSS